MQNQTQDYNQYNQQGGYYDPMMQGYNMGMGSETSTYDEAEKEFLREILDVSELLEDFEHRVLRGEYKTKDAEKGEIKWVRMNKEAQPIINEIGIREVIARIMGYVNKSTRLTWFDDEEIYKNMFYFDASLAEFIAKRADLWELDIETAKAIKDSAIELVQSVVFAARNGFTAINVKSQYMKQDITRTDQQQNQPKSFLGIPLGGKR